MRDRRTITSVLALAALIGVGPRGATAQQPDDAPAGSSATERALAELSAAYESLAGLLDQGSDEAVDRVQGDLENLGDWEYRIVELDDDAPEAIEAELNALGNERWEAYWVESHRDGLRFYLKRPAISYLSRIPLSTLVRMMSGAAQ